MIELENLTKTGQLKAEAPDAQEIAGMVRAAENKLRDVGITGLSVDGQFSLAYGAAHALSLAALRHHGYRSESRYLVFQCLQHTVGLSRSKWRVLDKCHNTRNLAEYEGHLDVDLLLLRELIEITHELLERVKSLPDLVAP